MRDGEEPLRDHLASTITRAFQERGHEVSSSLRGVSFVLNLTDPGRPRPGRRNSQAVFIVTLVAMNADVHADLRTYSYCTLVRTLSNLLITIRRDPSTGREQVFFTTPEAGHYAVGSDPSSLYQAMTPIVASHYMIENRTSYDLPERLWNGTTTVDEIRQYSRELDTLGILPLPFPLKEVLSQEDLRHLYHIYGMTGLSYGNLSAREHVPELGNATFWMTGRGVDKRNLGAVGKDILLVHGVDNEAQTVLVSSPPGADPSARVSVDAVEHELIYRTFPQVGAILHVHAWTDHVLATRQNYPCGTRELAEEVVELLRHTETPERAAVGLKNHGLTITGPSLEEIFERVRGVDGKPWLRTEVPMFE